MIRLIILLLCAPLMVIFIGLIIGARWSWQTAKSKGRTNRGFLGYYSSGESRGFSEKEDTFEGLLARSTPWCFITPIIIALNILVFAVMGLAGVSLFELLFEPEANQLLLWGANYGPLTVSGEWWRLFSSNFLHIGFFHLFINMLFLWILGNYAERMFGNLTFLMLYALSGLGGSVVSLWWHPIQISAGASGAIFGVVGGIIMFLFLGKLPDKHRVGKSDLAPMLYFFGYNVIFGFMESGIDNAAHLGGLFVGLVIGGFLHRPLPPSKVYSRLRHYIVFSGLSLSLFFGAQSIKTKVVKDPVTKLVSAEKFIELGEFDQAIAECTKAIELDPNFAWAYRNRGIAYAQGKGQYDKAISDYTKAIELNPRFAEAYHNLGLAYLDTGRPGEAITSLSKAVELKPDLALAHYALGRAYIKKKLYDEAIDSYRKAVELKPDVAEYYLWLGNAYANRGLRDEAIDSWEKVLELKPDHSVAFHNLQRIKIQKAKERNTGLQDPQEACEQDCKKMFEKGELRRGMTVEECIKDLCK